MNSVFVVCDHNQKPLCSFPYEDIAIASILHSYCRVKYEHEIREVMNAGKKHLEIVVKVLEDKPRTDLFAVREVYFCQSITHL